MGLVTGSRVTGSRVASYKVKSYRLKVSFSKLQVTVNNLRSISYFLFLFSYFLSPTPYSLLPS